MGPGFTLELTSYTPDERELALERLQTALMSGQGYDMFFWDGHPLGVHLDAGLFMDFYTLIACREDFYTNVLEAWEHDGRLYVFPLSVEFTYVGISTHIPQAFVDRFIRYGTITNQELMRIYIDLLDEFWEDFGHIAFLNGHMPSLHHVMGNFIDFKNRSAALNDRRFSQFLEDLKRIADMDIRVDYTNIRWYYEGMMADLPYHYVFMTIGQWIDPMSAIFDPPEPGFIHFIPIADDYGRLVTEQYVRPHWFDWSEHWSYDLSPSWGSVSISAAGDGILAWEFTQQLISSMVVHDERNLIMGTPLMNVRHFGSGNLMSPIKRAYLRPHVEAYFYRHFGNPLEMDTQRRRYYGLPLIPTERNIQLDHAIGRLEAFSKMPVVLAPYLPGSLYEDPLADFMAGTISAQHAADIIHNRVALWLIE